MRDSAASSAPRMPPGNANNSTTRIVPKTNGQYSVNAVICWLSKVSTSAPTAGPQKCCMPPRIVMIITSADFDQYTKSAKTPRLKIPNNAPDNDYSGYNFWLNKMNQFSQPGEDVTNESVALSRVKRAEMVKSFLVSKEYRERFQGGADRGNQQGSIAMANPADGLTNKIAKRMRFVFNVALLRALMPS